MADIKPLESRSIICEVRADESEKGNIITGRPVVYDSMTDLGCFDEIIEKGALDETDLTDVRFLVNHDTSRIPLARSRRNNGNSTMKLDVDDKGLTVDVTLDTENNEQAKALYSAIQRDDITGMSFMFSVDDEEWENIESEHPTRRIKKIGTIVEVSAVSFPAYDATSIQARDKAALESARLALESAKQSRAKSLDSDTAETLKLKIKILGGLK